MNLSLELKKIKRTGIIPAFIVMAFLAGAVPIINIAVRTQLFTNSSENPLSVLVNENWQMMSMLNVLIISIGACLFYNIEYADNAIQKMRALPLKEISLFNSKAIVLGFMSILVILIESLAFMFCILNWFESSEFNISDLCRNFGYSALLTIPSVIFALIISSICRNMWVSLGIQVVGIFTATMLPANKFIMSVFPYSLAFQTYIVADSELIHKYMIASAIEIIVFEITEVILIKIRRASE